MATTTMMVMAAASAVAAGIEQSKQLKGQAKALDQQARVADANASRTRLEGSLNEDVQRAQNRQAMSASRALMSEMGMSESATSTGVLAQDAANAEQNALNIRYKTESEARNYDQQASDARFGAGQARKQARRAFYMGLLQGGADAFSTYANSRTPTDSGASNNWLWGGGSDSKNLGNIVYSEAGGKVGVKPKFKG